MEAFIIILAFIWSILSIILFFKVWKMCNDVSAIKEIVVPKSKQDTRTSLLLGDKATAASRIIAKNINRLMQQYDEASDTSLSEEERLAVYSKMDKTIAALNKVFADLSLGELPEHLKSREAFLNYLDYLKTN